MLTLSVPVMLSLVVEPLAGVVDTAFVERLGAPQAAALGAATAILSSFLWLFNFLGVGTQTEVAHVVGGDRRAEVREVASLAMLLSLGFAAASGLLVWTVIEPVAAWMSPEAAVQSATVTYLSLRLFGFPAGLVLLAAFGVLRGLQDMRTPMWIAGVMSLANVLLDALLIFGWGPIPALGIAGAALATVVSQVAGAAVACFVVVRRVGWSWSFTPSRVGALFVVGRDMVLRTAALLFFMLLATRVALQMGSTAGAGHQAIRQIWMLLAFLLDAYAATTQSLIAYFRGAGRAQLARRVAGVGVLWGLATGFALSLALWLAEPAVAALLVPPEARAVFAAGWPIFVLSQPLNALSFVTDGIHWGTGDFAYLRNGMLTASVVGVALLLGIDTSTPRLDSVWLVTAIWIGVRSAFGLVRVWPGFGEAPLARAD
jgi:MATE family multidrug resistance protein